MFTSFNRRGVGEIYGVGLQMSDACLGCASVFVGHIHARGEILFNLADRVAMPNAFKGCAFQAELLREKPCSTATEYQNQGNQNGTKAASFLAQRRW